MYPQLNISLSSNNLLQNINIQDGVAAIMGTGTTAGLLGIPKTVFSLSDAVQQGFTQAAEPAIYRHIEEFYQELGGNQELHIMIVPDTMTLAQMADYTNLSGLRKLLNAAQGKVRKAGIYRVPSAGYNAGNDFLDSDVSAAVTACLAFGQAQFKAQAPVRTLIAGRVANPAAPNTFTPNTASNGFAGVVLGGSLNDGSASIGTVLGRAVKYPAQVKLGKVSNGPLALTNVYIGDKLIGDRLDMTTFYDAGFLTFITYPMKAGVYIGVDQMCSSDDYNILVHGLIVDKAALVSAQTYVNQLESEADVDAQGNLTDLETAHLKGMIIQNINAQMADQISGLTVSVDGSNYVNTSTINVSLGIQPKGYNTIINVVVGLTATTSNQ